MNLKWQRERSSHYCYNDDNGRVLAELYEHTLTNHVTAWFIPLSDAQREAYGTWVSLEAGKKAVEAELEYRDEFNL